MVSNLQFEGAEGIVQAVVGIFWARDLLMFASRRRSPIFQNDKDGCILLHTYIIILGVHSD